MAVTTLVVFNNPNALVCPIIPIPTSWVRHPYSSPHFQTIPTGTTQTEGKAWYVPFQH